MNKITFAEQVPVIQTYSLLLTVLPIINLPIFAEAFYCLVFKSPALQKTYVRILTFHVTLCFLSEVYGCLLMRPVVVLPIIGFYSDGLLNYFHIHTFLQLLIVFLIYQINSSAVIQLFLFRLKSVIPVTFRYYSCLIRTGVLSLVLLYILSFLSVCYLSDVYVDQYSAKTQLLASGYLDPPMVPPNIWSENFVLTDGSDPHFRFVLSTTGGFIIFQIIVSILLPVVAYTILIRTKDTLSANVVKAQKTYLKSLILQVGVLLSFMMFPIGIFITAILFKIQSPATVSIGLLFFNAHGMASTLALLLANKPYRQVLKSQGLYVIRVICRQPIQPSEADTQYFVIRRKTESNIAQTI